MQLFATLSLCKTTRRQQLYTEFLGPLRLRSSQILFTFKSDNLDFIRQSVIGTNGWRHCIWYDVSPTLNLIKPSGHYMYHSLTFNNPTFCSHSVFICFLWISEQTAIISIYNINWLVFIIETGSVYCAVRTGSFHFVHHVSSRSIHVKFVMDSDTGTGFSVSTAVFPVIVIPPTLHSHLPLHGTVTKDNQAKPGNPPKKQCFFKNRGTLDRKVLSFFSVFRMLILCHNFVCAKVRNSIDKEAALFGTARPQMSSMWSFVTSGYRVASVFESEAAQEVWRWVGSA